LWISTEDDGSAISAPGGGDDGGLGLAGRVEDGNGFAGGELDFIDARRRKDLNDFTGGGEEA
jgi:hypothetical protein